MRLLSGLIACALIASTVLVASCASDGSFTLNPSKISGSVTSAKTAQDVQWACATLGGLSNLFTTLEPIFAANLDAGQKQAATAAAAGVAGFCATPANGDTTANFARVMDAAGQVESVLVASGKVPAS